MDDAVLASALERSERAMVAPHIRRTTMRRILLTAAIALALSAPRFLMLTPTQLGMLAVTLLI